MHGELPVVQRLVGEVAGVSAGMLEALLQRLQGAVQLPECLRVIGYLRRLAAFPGGWGEGGRWGRLARTTAACSHNLPAA
jgi:hypothetical protein